MSKPRASAPSSSAAVTTACLLVLRLKKICEIYSRVLGSDEALHVSSGTRSDSVTAVAPASP